MSIGAVSYGVAAGAFLVLFALLTTSWRGRLKGGLLLAAVLVSALWALAAAYQAQMGAGAGNAAYYLLEMLRCGLWLAFLFQLLDPVAPTRGVEARLWLALRPGLLALAAALVVLDLVPASLAKVLPEHLGVDLRIFGHVILAVAGLALVEQLFRNTRQEQRWATKFLYLGIGTLFAYDFYLYADALLFRRLDVYAWGARGLINATVVPLLGVAAARNPEWSVSLFVSRRMVIHTATVFGAGLYLLLMAAAGYYIRVYGGSWGPPLQLAFLVAAGLLLAVMMFSGQVRAHLKVLLSKHFFHYKYDYRDEWIRFMATLSTEVEGEPLRQRAIRSLAEIVDSPGGLLWARRPGGRHELVAGWNMGERGAETLERHEPLVRFLEHTGWVVDLADCQADPERYSNTVPPAWMMTLERAWIVVPLAQGEQLQGFMVLARPRAPRSINWEDRDLLKTAGRQVAGYIALVDATDALMDARQFEAFNRLSAFVVHDLKNVVAQLSLVVSNASQHKHNPAFVDDAILTVENAVSRMNRMLAQLRKGAAVGDEGGVCQVADALAEAVATCAGRSPTPRLTGCEPQLAVGASREGLAAVLGHLVQNAQEATTAGGRVELCARAGDGAVVIEVSDDGCGMEAAFIRDRLFRPFATTKGNAGMGIGVYESREFARALGGELDVVSEPGAGTRFFLRLPPARMGAVSEQPDREVVSCLTRTGSY